MTPRLAIKAVHEDPCGNSIELAWVTGEQERPADLVYMGQIDLSGIKRLLASPMAQAGSEGVGSCGLLPHNCC